MLLVGARILVLFVVCEEMFLLEYDAIYKKKLI